MPCILPIKISFKVRAQGLCIYYVYKVNKLFRISQILGIFGSIIELGSLKIIIIYEGPELSWFKETSDKLTFQENIGW